MDDANRFPVAEDYLQPIIDPLHPVAVSVEEPTCTCGCKPSTT
jgi:hypothetical protein